MDHKELAAGWTFETMLSHVAALIETNLVMINANDARYEQRFLDSKIAVDAALNAAKTAVDAALSAAKEAVAKAETASEKRFDGVNEFRLTLSDQQRTLMPRAEAELRMNSLADQINAIKEAQIRNVGRSVGIKDSYGFIEGLLGVLMAIAAMYFK
jgi:uncharacterized membrane protein